MDKAAKYHNWVTLPFRSVTVDGPPFSVPRYLHLDLGKQTQRNVVRFRLHSHALQVETRSWEHHDGTCDKCGLQAIQDENTCSFFVPLHANVFVEASICRLVSRFTTGTKNNCRQTGAFCFSQACSEDVFNFFQKQTNYSYRFISELMDVFLWLVFTSNLNSQTTWLKVKLKLVNLWVLEFKLQLRFAWTKGAERGN